MNVVERVDSFRNLVTSSFENVMDTMEKVHQTSAELSVDLLKELGIPDDRAEGFKDTHRRVLRTVYGSICHVNNEFGDLVVTEAELLSRFFEGLLASLKSGNRGPATWQDMARLDADPEKTSSTRRRIG